MPRPWINTRARDFLRRGITKEIGRIKRNISGPGGFWAGELWKLFAATDDPRCQALATTWTSRLLGNENKENHDTGFLNLYSSVLGYDLSNTPEYKAGGIKGSGAINNRSLIQIIGLISSWGPNADDTIIDTMMNLQIWWWATRETGDPQWRVLGLKHSLKSADCLLNQMAPFLSLCTIIRATIARNSRRVTR